MPPRSRKPRTRRPPRTVTAVFPLSAFGISGGDDHLYRACEIIATRAKELSSVWSVRVPKMMRIAVAGNVGIIEDYAPPGRPAELQLNHPLFANRRWWYGPPGPPFLRPAAEQMIDPAALEYAKTVDDHARKLGWK